MSIDDSDWVSPDEGNRLTRDTINKLEQRLAELQAEYAAYKLRNESEVEFMGQQLTGAACFWKYNDIHRMYYTGCEHTFYFIVDGVIENRFTYCPFCGGKIRGG